MFQNARHSSKNAIGTQRSTAFAMASWRSSESNTHRYYINTSIHTYIHTHYSPVALIKTSTNACQTVSKSPSVHLRKFLEPRTVQYVKKERPISSTIIQHLCRRDQQFKTRLVWCYPTIAQGLAKSACGHNAGRYLM